MDCCIIPAGSSSIGPSNSLRTAAGRDLAFGNRGCTTSRWCSVTIGATGWAARRPRRSPYTSYWWKPGCLVSGTPSSAMHAWIRSSLPYSAGYRRMHPSCIRASASASGRLMAKPPPPYAIP
ncbi:Os04g0578833 [Oryza sativa Japonica Group]|uniref:Os04g0578833 protein n=1 Tax=Oryza sativa subsp. japonica TaxID=39947 RepID=A0A0P0WDZ3_ORYSJ|nr:hypothetical protein EE612_025124 [Oryza sativa]BAS90634.1 Os04g0578833 [Oryza sativa Japonica Group]